MSPTRPKDAPTHAPLNWSEFEGLLRDFWQHSAVRQIFGPYGPAQFLAVLKDRLSFLGPARQRSMLGRIAEVIQRQELLDPDTWRGLAHLAGAYVRQMQSSRDRRRHGDYELDDYGMDPEWVEAAKPFLRFLYRNYWRVETSGIENIPSKGRALLVANHSGVLPWDGAMINVAMWEEHPEPRHVRTLHLDWFVALPFVSIFLARTGQVLACPENGSRMLEEERLVAVFPEGVKGVSKLFRDRYRLARFGRGGFVKMALAARAPIIPVSVVGAEEVHPMVTRKLDFLAKPLGMPFFPVTPTFPWLGLFGLIPLPSKWRLHFGKPVDCSGYPAEAANDFLTVSNLTEQVRGEIQRTVRKLRRRRKTMFW